MFITDMLTTSSITLQNSRYTVFCSESDSGTMVDIVTTLLRTDDGQGLDCGDAVSASSRNVPRALYSLPRQAAEAAAPAQLHLNCDSDSEKSLCLPVPLAQVAFYAAMAESPLESIRSVVLLDAAWKRLVKYYDITPKSKRLKKATIALIVRQLHAPSAFDYENVVVDHVGDLELAPLYPGGNLRARCIKNC
jgi:hypothetical protein